MSQLVRLEGKHTVQSAHCAMMTIPSIQKPMNDPKWPQLIQGRPRKN